MVANIFGTLFVVTCNFISGRATIALAEWLRRVPAKYMGFPRESSNLSGDVYPFLSFPFFNSVSARTTTSDSLSNPYHLKYLP